MVILYAEAHTPATDMIVTKVIMPVPP